MSTPAASFPPFLADGGAMGGLMRQAAWPASFPQAADEWAVELQVATSLILHAKHPMFLLWGKERHCLYNDGYIEILGHRHPEALGRPYDEVWPEVWDQLEPMIRRAWGGEGTFVEDMPLVVERNGRLERVCFTFSHSPLFAADGSITGMFCACSETTDRVSGTQALLHSHEALRRANEDLLARLSEEQRVHDRVWRLSHDIIADAGRDGRFRSINPALGAMLGWSAEELIDRPFLDLIHPDDAAAAAAAMRSLDAGTTASQVQFRTRHKDGSVRWVSWTIVPEGDTLSMIGRDVTADREQRRALAEAEDALRHAQKMEAVGQLTGGIAHDFNNLLTGIIGSLEMMKRRAAQGRPADVERFAAAATTSANRAAALTHRLLAFSRRQSLDPRPVDADRLVRGMEDMFRRTIGADITLEIVGTGGLWETYCDAHQLENALLNLVINARDAMPEGGRLTIETRNAHLDQAYADRVRDVTPGQYVCVSVTDTGVGMEPEVISRAFDPFFTTKPIGQGTGLGLSMIYGFARQSEGVVRLYSHPGQGTTVNIYLPRHRGQGSEGGGRKAGVAPASSPEERVVLVVEDEDMIRDLVMDVVEDLGFRTLEAHDGPSGLRIVQSDVRIDLIVTDVGLPGFNGRQLADAAREARPDVRVLFMTGYAHNAALGNGLLEPGMQVITKPFPIDALADRIGTLMRD